MNNARQALGFRLLALTFGLVASSPVVAQATVPAAPAQVPAAPVVPSAPAAKVMTTEAALQRVFSAKTVDAAWFPPAFKPVLPQVQESVTSLQTQYGALQKVEKAGTDYRLTYARGVVTVTADLDREGLLTTLLLKDARAIADAAVPGSPAPGSPAQSGAVQTDTPVQAALRRVFGAPKIDPAWFTPAFKELLPQLQTGTDRFRSQYGKVLTVEGGEAGIYRVGYERGVVTVQASVDAAGVLTGLLLQGSASAQSDPATLRALGRLYSGPTLDPAWFAPSFLAQVPVAQLQVILAQLAAGLGAFQQVRFEQGYALVFEKGRVPITTVQLDAQGRFIGLTLGVPVRAVRSGSFAEVVAALKALPGQTSLLIEKVTPGARTEVAALNPDVALAIGSAFKLAILAELQVQVAAGKLSWTTEATLQDADKSLPSGTLQNEPSGSRHTLQQLAEAMISMSDNTATNLLLRTVGRAGVEARLKEAPMLDTRELFALKNPANSALLDRYLKTTGEARRAVIAEAAKAPLSDLTTLGTSPLTLNLEVEWHVSARALCALMNEVAALPLTSLNPGVAAPADFTKVSFKGGSDGGVLNLTTQVVTRKGETYCVSATWNNTQPVDDFRFIPLVQDALALLK